MKKPRKPKPIAQIPSLLIEAGHLHIEFECPRYGAYSATVEPGKPYVWFPSLNLMFIRYDNRPLMMKRKEDGRWLSRRGRGGWWILGEEDKGPSPLESYLETTYNKFFADLIVGAKDDDSTVAEGRSVQGSLDGQGS